MEINNLCWVSSFFDHPNRGTWYNKRYKSWHKIDGFVTTREERIKLIKNVRTDSEFSLSDHKPKTMTIASKKPKMENQQLRRQGKEIDWEKLDCVEVRMKFQHEMNRQLSNKEKLGTGITWECMSKMIQETGQQVVGFKRKEGLNPCFNGHEEEIAKYKQGIMEYSREIVRVGNANEKRRLIDKRKKLRKKFKEYKKQWENEWWERKIDECKIAEQKHDSRNMYKILKDIGVRDANKEAMREEFFTPSEYKAHSEKVSKDRFERTMEEIEELKHNIPKIEVEEYLERADLMEQEITRKEFDREIKLIHNGAPGEDGIMIKTLKNAGEKTLSCVLEIIQRMHTSDAESWERVVKSGLMIPLHKKGSRNELNNYRGVCLLSMASRILARIMATRVREWIEDIKYIDDIQCGFRAGRSTADASQVIIRVNEEVQRVIGVGSGRQNTDRDHPVAVLMDITKAYPRVNRNILWHVLRKLGMKDVMLKTLQNLHERTEYKVKGRVSMSEAWEPQRGLREGCATSPILFNIYHACVMKLAEKERSNQAKGNNMSIGIPWIWKPGYSFPPKSQTKAMNSFENEKLEIAESVFADDTTILGTKNEIFIGRDSVMEVMNMFEEKCHPDKEEHLFFGESESESIRMLGSFVGRKKDNQERLKRVRQGVWKVKKRLWKTKMSKINQARIVEVIVESSVLFDCAVKPWNIAEISKLQRVLDEAYRYIWSKKNKGPVRIQMETEKVNMFGIRQMLGIESLRAKIERRSLQRMGHALRMPNDRLTKKVCLTLVQKGRKENRKADHHTLLEKVST